MLPSNNATAALTDWIISAARARTAFHSHVSLPGHARNGETRKALFDLYRDRLAHIKIPASEPEREEAQRVGSWLVYGRGEAAPAPTPAAHAGTAAGPAASPGRGRRLILSRKAFDATAGGGSSPILPSGHIVPLPIPGGVGGIPYSRIEWDVGKDLASLMAELGIEDPGLAHHDPDLVAASRPRESGWRPIFGQADKASQHLANQGIGSGDVFLFFGRFRWTERTSAGLGFVGDPLHVLWGYLEVGEVREPTGDPAPPPWARDHPHYACTSEPWFTKSNRVYIAAETSSLVPGAPGGGAFPLYRDELRLSSASGPMSRWRLPLALHPDRRGVLMSNTSEAEWSTDGTDAFLQVVGQRQEFVLPMDTDVEAWVRQMIRSWRASDGPGTVRDLRNRR